mgnify:CR=1 FL=1
MEPLAYTDAKYVKFTNAPSSAWKKLAVNRKWSTEIIQRYFRW